MHNVIYFASQKHCLQQPQSWKKGLGFVTFLTRCPNHHFCFPLGLLYDSSILGCAAVACCLPTCLLAELFCTCKVFYLGVYWKCKSGVESPQDGEKNNSKSPASHMGYLTNSMEKNLNIYRSSACCHNFSLFSSSQPAEGGNSVLCSSSEPSVSSWEEGSSPSCLGYQNPVLFLPLRRGEQALLLH